MPLLPLRLRNIYLLICLLVVTKDCDAFFAPRQALRLQVPSSQSPSPRTPLNLNARRQSSGSGGSDKRLSNLPKKTTTNLRRRTPVKLTLIICSAVVAFIKRGSKRQIAVSILATVLANMVCNRLTTDSSGESSSQTEEEVTRIRVRVEPNFSPPWDDEERIDKAMKKHKISQSWIDQSMTHLQATKLRVSAEKAQEAALLEAQRKAKAKLWVTATMHSANRAREQAQETKKREDDANLKAKKWAESAVRSTGIDL